MKKFIYTIISLFILFLVSGVWWGLPQKACAEYPVSIESPVLARLMGEDGFSKGKRIPFDEELLDLANKSISTNKSSVKEFILTKGFICTDTSCSYQEKVKFEKVTESCKGLDEYYYRSVGVLISFNQTGYPSKIEINYGTIE